jgi:hypothetical protein
VDDDTVALTKDKRDHETEVGQKREGFEAAIALAEREPDPAEIERFLKEYDSTFDDFNEMAIQVRCFPQPAPHQFCVFIPAPPPFNRHMSRPDSEEFCD